jgi:hypothetical protein
MSPLFAAFAVIVAALTGWFIWCKRQNTRRAAEILNWIETTLGPHGRLESVVWLNASRFRTVLYLGGHSVFRRAAVRVDLTPRELPHRWIKHTLSGEQETVTFEADLETIPKFQLDLHNIKLFARTRPDLQPVGDGWQYEHTTPLIMTTRNEWSREISGVISALLHAREKHFLDLRFTPRSPHYTVKLPLDAISPSCTSRFEMASAIRELAVEASSYHGLNF